MTISKAMDPLSGTRADDAAVTAAAAAATARYRANLERFNATPKQAPPPTPDAPAARLIRLCLLAHEESHATALDEIRRGRKTSHWIWWEWPAFAPVRATSRPEYDLRSAAAAAAWLEHATLAPRWAEMTATAVEHLEQGRPAPALFGSGTDAAKFHESCTLASLVAPRAEQRELAARAVRALKLPPHAGVLRAVEAERERERSPERGAQVV